MGRVLAENHDSGDTHDNRAFFRSGKYAVFLFLHILSTDDGGPGETILTSPGAWPES